LKVPNSDGNFCQKKLGSAVMFRKALLPVFALVIATSAATPAFCQNRFMDEAREKNERREENKAVRDAENPDPTKTQTANAAPAAPAAAAPAPAAPAAAAPATPAPAQ
jgi:hypothetical protein